MSVETLVCKNSLLSIFQLLTLGWKNRNISRIIELDEIKNIRTNHRRYSPSVDRFHK